MLDGMHPPEFRLAHHLSDWPECFIEACCPTCKRSTVAPTKLLMHQRGDMLVIEAVKRFRCGRCRVAAAPVYLCASHHRQFCYGPDPGWAIELVPEPRG
jgi:hypothetical protein